MVVVTIRVPGGCSLTFVSALESPLLKLVEFLKLFADEDGTSELPVVLIGSLSLGGFSFVPLFDLKKPMIGSSIEAKTLSCPINEAVLSLKGSQEGRVGVGRGRGLLQCYFVEEIWQRMPKVPQNLAPRNIVNG